jgi:hypothetical protein
MDNPNEATSIGMRNNEETIPGRHAKRDVARLPMRMIGIPASQCQSVPQCSCRLFKRDPMLPEGLAAAFRGPHSKRIEEL